MKPIKVHLKHETFHECFSVKMYVKMCVIFGDVTCQGSEDGDERRTFVWYKFSDLDGYSLPSVEDSGQNLTQNPQGNGRGSPDLLKLYQGKTD